MALGLGVVFFGYWVSLFGFASLRGPGVGFVDLIVPGRTVNWPAGGSGADGSQPATITPAGISSLDNATCAEIKAFSPATIAAILKEDPNFALRLLTCGLPGPLGTTQRPPASAGSA